MSYIHRDRLPYSSTLGTYEMTTASLRIACLLFVATAAARADNIIDYYLVTTDISGARMELDNTHSGIWLFQAASTWNVLGAKFWMKEDQGATAATVLALWEGLPSSGSKVTEKQLSHTDFCAQVSNCQQFDEHDYQFPSQYTLTSGLTYTLVLSSDVQASGSQQYSLKSDGAKAYFYDSSVLPNSDPPAGAGLPPGNLNGPIQFTYGNEQDLGLAAVPEPLSFLLVGSGLLLVCRRRRSGLVPANRRQSTQ
jgi:PEP-CTERM motif